MRTISRHVGTLPYFENTSSIGINCSYIFIHQVTLARPQRSNLSVSESSCHLPTCLTTYGGGFTLSLFIAERLSREAVNINFTCFWFDQSGNRARVHRCSTRCSEKTKTTELQHLIHCCLCF